VADDSILNVYQIETSGPLKSLKHLTKVDLNNEMYAMASNSVDKLVLGGDENKVDLHTFSGGVISSETLAAPYLAMQFQSKVSRLQWVCGRFVIGYSENDSVVQVFNTETEAVLRFHLDENTTAKNGAMDPL